MTTMMSDDITATLKRNATNEYTNFNSSSTIKTFLASLELRHRHLCRIFRQSAVSRRADVPFVFLFPPPSHLILYFL